MESMLSGGAGGSPSWVNQPGGGGGSSWAARRRANADATDAYEADSAEYQREYAEMRRRAARDRAEDAKHASSNRARMLRGLRLLCIYVFAGAALKCSLMWVAFEARQHGWAELWVVPYDYGAGKAGRREARRSVDD